MTVLAIYKSECDFCGTKKAIITKVDYENNRVQEIRTKPCYECGAVSWKQERLIDEGETD